MASRAAAGFCLRIAVSMAWCCLMDCAGRPGWRRDSSRLSWISASISSRKRLSRGLAPARATAAWKRRSPSAASSCCSELAMRCRALCISSRSASERRWAAISASSHSRPARASMTWGSLARRSRSCFTLSVERSSRSRTVPPPCRVWTRPCTSRTTSACLTEARLVPSCSARSRSEGKRSPRRRPAVVACSRRRSRIASYIGARSTRRMPGPAGVLFGIAGSYRGRGKTPSGQVAVPVTTVTSSSRST